MLSTAAVGIDITEQQVRIVCLKKSFKAVHLVAAEKCLLAEDQAFKDKIVNISDFINDFLKDKRISAADIHIGIPTEQVIFREIELPLAVKENLTATLAYEMEKYVPLAAADVYYDFQIIAEDRERDVLTISLAVAKRADLDAYLQIAAALDLTPAGISPGCAGIVNSFLDNVKNQAPLQLLAFAEENQVELQVIRARRLVYARKLPPAVKEGRSGENNAQDVRTTQIKSLMQQFGTPEAPAVLYLHALTLDVAVSETLEQAAGNAFQGTEPPAVDLPANEYIPAYGLALQAFETAAGSINFLPASKRKKPNKIPFYLMYALAAGLLLTGLLWTGIFLDRQHAWEDHLDQKRVELRAEVTEIEEMRSERDELKSRIDRLESLRPGNAYVVNVLLELTRRIPKTAWVKDLNISGNDVRLYGMAESASNLIPVLEEAPLFHDVEFLSTIRKTGTAGMYFESALSLVKINQTGVSWN